MGAKHLLNSILRKWPIVVLMTVVACMATTYFSIKSYKPFYKSSATLLAINANSSSEYPVSYADMMAGQQLVKELKEVVRSKLVADEVTARLNIPGLTSDRLIGSTSVSLRDDTRILTISITEQSPELAKMLVEAVCDVFVVKAQELTRIEDIKIIDKAELSGSPIKPQYTKYSLIGFLGGLLASILLIFLMEELDDTIKTVDDVENQLGLRVLGTIPMLNIK